MKKRKKRVFFCQSEAAAFVKKYRKNFTKGKAEQPENCTEVYLSYGNTYSDIRTSIYNGMPEFSEDFHPSHEDFPIHCVLLFKIALIHMSQIIWGKTVINGKLVEQNFRQYEFQLFGDVTDGWGIMYLFIKDKNHFFNEQEPFKILQGSQKIPLTYETMSKMSEKELTTIYLDLD